MRSRSEGTEKLDNPQACAKSESLKNLVAQNMLIPIIVEDVGTFNCQNQNEDLVAGKI